MYRSMLTLTALFALSIGNYVFAQQHMPRGTATDVTNPAKTANTSPLTTVNAGAFTKLAVKMPGQTALLHAHSDDGNAVNALHGGNRIAGIDRALESVGTIDLGDVADLRHV